MRELSLNVMDIAQNSISAGASLITVEVVENQPGDTLSISVGEAVESLEDYYEPYLIQQGYLKRTQRGRCVTDKAYALLGISGRRGHADQGLLF